MKVYYNIQLLRFIAAFNILLYHLFATTFTLKHGIDYSYTSFLFYHGRAGVDLFFIISGFIMAFTTENTFNNKSNALSFFIKRVSRIYPPYLFFTVLVFCVFLIKPDWINSTAGNIVSLFRSFTLIPQKDSHLIAVAWTLEYELYFYCIFSIFILMKEKNLLRNLFIWAIIALSAGFIVKEIHPILKVATSPLLLEFIIGACIAIFIRRTARFTPLYAGIIALIAGLSLFCLNYIPSFQNLFKLNFWMRFVMYGIPQAFILYGVVLLENKKYSFPQFKILGDSTYTLYLSHVLVVSAISRIWIALDLKYIFDSSILVLIIIITAVAFSVLFYKIIEKRLTNITRSFLFRIIKTFRESATQKNN